MRLAMRMYIVYVRETRRDISRVWSRVSLALAVLLLGVILLRDVTTIYEQGK